MGHLPTSVDAPYLGLNTAANRDPRANCPEGDEDISENRVGRDQLPGVLGIGNSPRISL
jgi:hypothetical protein